MLSKGYKAIVKKSAKNYEDPICCPVCGKVFGEWKKVNGEVTIRKYCPRCKRFVDIGKKNLTF